MKIKLSNALCVLAFLVPSIAPAKAVGDMKPGQYTYTVQVNMMGMNIPGVSFNQCVTQKDVDDGRAYVNQNQMKNCTRSEPKRDGDRISFAMTCTDPKMTVTGNGTIGPDRADIVSNVEMEGGPMPMTQKQTLSVRRIGECSP